MPRTYKIAIAVAFLLFLGVVVYSTLRLDKVTVEVCIEFKGRTDCGIATGLTEEEAIGTATNSACALIASGMADSMACSRTMPLSTRRIED
ncbi:MAG: hypothetical protein ACE5H2_09215 [Terriglobia bacterium]